MTFESAAECKNTVPRICLEINLETGPLYLATTALREPDKYWQGRLRHDGIHGLKRGVDLDVFQPLTDEAEFLLDDEDNAISQLMQQVSFDDRSAKVWACLQEAGTLKWHQLTAGTTEDRGEERGCPRIAVRPNIREWLGILQESIREKAFGSNIEKDSVGQGRNIVFGTIAENAAIRAWCVDTSNRYFDAAQHALKSVTGVWRLRSSSLTAIPGSDWSWLNTTDLEGNPCARIYVSSSYWQAGDKIYYSGTGMESAGDGSGTLLQNPSDFILEALRQFSELADSQIDLTSFADFKTYCTSQGLDTAGESGGVIPWEEGQLHEDQLEVLGKMAGCAGAMLYLNNEGALAVAPADTSSVSSDPVEIDIHDLTADIPRRETPQLNKLSQVRGLYGTDHRSKTPPEYVDAKIESVAEPASQEQDLPFIQGMEAAKHCLGPRILRRCNAHQIIAEFNGPHGCNREIGDIISLTHRHFQGGVQGKQYMITELDYSELMAGRMGFRGTMVGPGRYPVPVFSGEQELRIYPVIDTYVSEAHSSTAYGSAVILRHGEQENTWDDPWRLRTVFKIPLAQFDTLSAQIKTLIFRVRVTDHFCPSGQILKELNATGFSNDSTWGNFNGSAWSEANIGPTLAELPPTTGFRDFVLNSTGVDYVDDQRASNGGDGYAYFTFQAMNYRPWADEIEEMQLASTEHPTESWWPQLIATVIV